MALVNELHPDGARRSAAGMVAEPHERVDILRMNVARYRAMLASAQDSEHRHQIERVLLDYETELLDQEDHTRHRA
jgi:hypothetical protein